MPACKGIGPHITSTIEPFGQVFANGRSVSLDECSCRDLSRDSSVDRHNRSAQWFARTRRGGGAILHHRHIRPVLIREWSPKMDGIAATIWASQTTSSTWPPRQLVT
jgi:hypothetical protein